MCAYLLVCVRVCVHVCVCAWYTGPKPGQLPISGIWEWDQDENHHECVRACVHVCLYACVCACVHACMHAGTCARVRRSLAVISQTVDTASIL